MDLEIDKAIESHLIWKTRLAAHIRRHECGLIAETVAKDDRCELGKWLWGEGLEHARLLECEKLFSDHARFHAAVGEIVKRVNSRQHIVEDMVLGANSEYAAACDALVEDLVRLKNRLNALRLEVPRVLILRPSPELVSMGRSKGQD